VINNGYGIVDGHKDSLGCDMQALIRRLYPICRSITGEGVRQTISILKEYLSDIHVHEVPSGTPCFDWVVPKEWNIRDAYVVDPNGNKIVDFKKLNLHVVGYSIPVDKTVTLDELQEHLYSLPDQPAAVPYVTSYYKERWGFCISDDQRRILKPGMYHVYIDSDLKEGSLTYGEAILPGESTKEVFLSTYVCHPSMANNELSGPAVTAFLGRWLKSLSRRRYTYRIIFIPETIGSILYLSRNIEVMKRNVVAGFNVTCVGDDRAYSYLPSREGNSLADKVAKHVLRHHAPNYISYSFLVRGSDERQYCSPGVDLPVCSIMRSMYGSYPEYHTSLDDLNLVTPAGLYGAYEALQKCLWSIENNKFLKTAILCEPKLDKRGLYPSVGVIKMPEQSLVDMMNLIAYADGSRSLLDISDIINIPMWEAVNIAERLLNKGVLKEEDPGV